MIYTLEPLAHEDTLLWDDVVLRCEGSFAFHANAWREALANTFRQLTPAYFWIKEDGKPIGGLPAFIFQPIPRIKMLHSMPWNLFGGVLLTDTPSDMTQFSEAVERTLDGLVGEQGLCETVFTLSPEQSQTYGLQLINAGYQAHESYFTHVLKTHPDYDVLWQAYNKRVRGAVRKAEKTGVVVYDTEQAGDLQSFYELYLGTQKRLGGTPKPHALLEALFRSNIAKLAIAKLNGIIIAGLLYLYFGKTVTLWCGASVPEFWEYRPNNAIFHHIIKWACEAGHACVDFGASPPDNHGLIKFKEEFRAERADFVSYLKVHSPIKKAVWEKTEPTLRQIYTWVQQTRVSG